MATSDAMPLRPRRFHRAVPCLLLCAALLGPFDALHLLSFVQGVVWYGTRAAQKQVAQKFSRKRQQTPGQRGEDGKADAKRLTSSIKRLLSAEKLIEVLDRAVDEPIFNFIHASAAYTQLVKLKQKRRLQPRDWDGPVLLRLHARVEDMMGQDQFPARELSNVLWSIAQLSDQFSVPTQLLAALITSVLAKVKDMNACDLSNSMWASAKLRDVACTVLAMVPAVAAQIPAKAEYLVAQALSNCLWASGQLKDVSPEVLQAVPAIGTKIPNKAKDMKPQELSNCLFASWQLKDELSEVLEIVPAIVVEIPSKIQDMNPQRPLSCFRIQSPKLQVFLPLEATLMTS